MRGVAATSVELYQPAMPADFSEQSSTRNAMIERTFHTVED